MARQTVTVNIDVTVELESNMVRSDYGVRGSPVWYEAEDIDFAYLTIDFENVTVKLSELPKELRENILEWAAEQSENGEWE